MVEDMYDNDDSLLLSLSPFNSALVFPYFADGIRSTEAGE